MYNAVIFDTRNGRILKSYATFRGAKSAFTRMLKKSDCEHLECATNERYAKTGGVTANEKVVVYSIHDIKKELPIEICRVDVDTCCDPSTERYHCM